MDIFMQNSNDFRCFISLIRIVTKVRKELIHFRLTVYSLFNIINAH